MINSPQNAFIKRLVALRKDGNFRKAEGAFLLEGTRAVRDALKSQHTVGHLVLSKNLLGSDVTEELMQLAADHGVPVTHVSKDCFRKIADVKTPQGACVEITIPQHNLSEILSDNTGLYMVTFGINDPGNLGTIIRTAHAAGARAVIAVRPSVDPYNSKVVRATSASLLALPVIVVEERAALAALATNNIRLVCAQAGASADYRGSYYARPLAVAVGAEAAGLPAAAARAADTLVSLPMADGVESLNAAVSAALLLYEANREESNHG